MMRVKFVVIIIILALIIYFIQKRKFFLKSMYETLKVNPFLRGKIVRWLIRVLSKIFFRR